MEIKILWPITKSLTNTFIILFRQRSFFLKMQMKTIALENVLLMSYQNVWSTLEQQLKKTENVGWTTTRAAKVQWALTPLEGTPPLISFWCTRRDPFSLKVPVDLKNGFDDTCACSASVGWRLSWSLVGRLMLWYWKTSEIMWGMIETAISLQ